MAYDEGLAEILRGDLADVPGITEKRMFGGIAFLLDGNMLCGVHRDGGMFRVGKENETAALDIEGAGPMQFTGRKMGGLIDVTGDGLADDARRERWMRLAMGFVGGLPPK
ncbi:MAG: TfoX/Sxy family protein [Rhodobacter sp.]|nr:TfoX/Sxy family protein [Rhodobacter sp.]